MRQMLLFMIYFLKLNILYNFYSKIIFDAHLGKLDNCSENAACINQIGNFNCLCNQGLVDWGEANSLRITG